MTKPMAPRQTTVTFFYFDGTNRRAVPETVTSIQTEAEIIQWCRIRGATNVVKETQIGAPSKNKPHVELMWRAEGPTKMIEVMTADGTVWRVNPDDLRPVE